jgi:hypothetical protein
VKRFQELKRDRRSGYISRPKDRLFAKRPSGWYLFDFARSRHTNPARIPVSANADWY